MSSTVSPIRRLVAYGRVHRRRVWAASIFSIANKIFDLAPPLLIGMAVDVVVERENSLLAGLGVVEAGDQLIVLSALTVLVWLVESALEYAHKVGWRNLAQRIQHELRVDTYAHVQELEMAWFDDRSTGGLLAVLSDDVNQLERFLDVGANELIQVATTVLVIGGLFFALAPEVAWMAVLPMPFILWGSVHFQRLLEPRYAEVRAQVGSLNAQLANNLGGMATIQSFTSEPLERVRFGESSQAYWEANRRAIALASAFSPLIRMVIVVGFTATLLFGGKMALAGRLAVGAYAVMVFMTQRLLWPLTKLGETADLYMRAMASTTRILDLLDTPVGIVGGGDPVGKVRGELRLEGIDFSYGQAPVLDGLDLEIRPRETTAIVGATGSGKTTLVKLLLRFYDPDAGRVTLDGVDLRSFDLRSLRRNIGLVSQDVFLFHGTLRENITYGKPDANPAEIEAAARNAEAWEFICALPQGLDTVVGERGKKLSGGQRQRVSIARALLKDPPVLILDEATSSVDNDTEAAIQRSLERIKVGRTTVVIAHRLSTVRRADWIHVIDQGRVVESGRHDELVAGDGVYARLWSVQTGEVVADVG